VAVLPSSAGLVTKTGNVLTLTGPNGLTTTWEYDALGRQAKETRADGTTTTTNYEWWKTDANQSDAGPCVLFFSFAVKSIKVGDFRRGATCCCGHLVGNPCVALVGISFPPLIVSSCGGAVSSCFTDKSLTTTYEYDSFGNKTKSTITGSGIVSRSTSVEYSTDGKFPVKTTNALGRSETKTFDTKTGNVLTLTGPNGLTTTWEYDALGRQAKETRRFVSIWRYGFTFQ
jgi:YD repeat-containing protein